MYLVRKTDPRRGLRTAALDKFFRGRIGRYLEDCKVEENVQFRKIDSDLVNVVAVFFSEQVRRRGQFFFKTKKLESPIMQNLHKEVKENLLIPKLTQYSFPFPPPSAHMLNKILNDELGVLLRGEGRNGVSSSLYSLSYMREAIDSISQHMQVSITATSQSFETLTYIPYHSLLSWMRSNLASSSLGFFPNMNSLSRHYIKATSFQSKKYFITDESEIAISKNIGITKNDMKHLFEKVEETFVDHPTTKIEGVIATYVPWMLSAAVSNVAKMKTGVKRQIDNVHESLLSSVSLGTLLENIRGIQNLVRRETGTLLMLERTTETLFSGSESIRDLGYGMGRIQFSKIYPTIKAVCDHLDAFRGGHTRKVVSADGTPKFIYAVVMKLELDSLQEVAGFVRGVINEQLVSAKVICDLAKVMRVRRSVYRKIANVARQWKEQLLGDIIDCVGVCEGLNKQRRRAEEFAIASYSLRDTKKFERFDREMKNYNAALKSQHTKLYVLNQRLSRRIRAESSAIVQENDYLKRVTKSARGALTEAKILMARREREMTDVWNAREERLNHENAKMNNERRERALNEGDRVGMMRAARHTHTFDNKRKKVSRRCKYYYEKILAKRSKVTKKELSESERWDKFAQSVLKFLQSSIHLKEVIQHRKPQQRYGLSVSKVHQVELILEKLLSASRSEKLRDCLTKIKPIEQRMLASRTIMQKQLPKGCKDMKLLQGLEEMAKDNTNAIKRLEMVQDIKNMGTEELDKKLTMTRAEKRAREVVEASRAFADKIVENNERAIRRIGRINKALYGGRAKKEKASLFIQAVWNYKIMKNLSSKVRRKHLIILSQSGYRRWHATRVANALRVQGWLRHIKWGERQMYIVRAEVRDRMRDKLKKDKITRKLKNQYDKIWDVVNAKYSYVHKKVPGLILDKKPEILEGDDILTPRSKRRKNWAEATGGREELNEIEAAHVLVKFMKSLLKKDAGGFLFSQQWYGKWVKDRLPNRDQAIVIIQKIVRTQIERWGGGER